MLGWFKKKFKKSEETIEDSKNEDLSGAPTTPKKNEENSGKIPVNTEALQKRVIAKAEAVEEIIIADPEPEQEEKVKPEAKVEAKEEIIPKEIADAKIKVAERKPTPPPEIQEPKPAKKKDGLLNKLSEKLSRSRQAFTHQLDSIFLGKKEIDNELLEDLEELLITADLGYSMTEEILDDARKQVKRKELSNPEALKVALKKKIASFIEEAQEDAELVLPEKGPFIIMVIGVNGVGKTTSIGKIANKFVKSGQSVMLVACDTFRAAAVSQLKIWGDRNDVLVYSHDDGADPSSVAFDGIGKAVEEEYDVVIIDTAGRMHTQANLMEELKKIKRVIGKRHEGAPHEVMLVIDATTGQNGISQAKLFNEAVGITGITLTKLDGTAKGGIVANISRSLQTPIRFIGVGEQIEDLRDFDHKEFIDALFESKAEEKE
ncbi:MAG: signal recognition particle-docking protein FtsY [Desulfotalea sp.]